MDKDLAHDDVADQVEICNLINRVQQMVDMGEVEEYLDLFTDDAVWVQPADPNRGVAPDERRGKSEIRAGVEERRAAGIQGPGTNTRHTNSTLSVHLEPPDTAMAVSYFQYFTETSTTPTLRLMGWYRHTVRRTPDGWKVARRELHFG